MIWVLMLVMLISLHGFVGVCFVSFGFCVLFCW